MGVVKKTEFTKAQLQLDGANHELPVIIGSEGERGIDVATLRAQTGWVTLDNAYVNTAACESAITFLNGEEGILRYRGYSIEELAANASFEEVASLLNKGELPSSKELQGFRDQLAQYHQTDTQIEGLLRALPKELHPMGAISAAIVALSGCEPHFVDQDLSTDQKDEVVAQLMSQLKNITAYLYRIRQGETLIPSDPNLGYCADFMNMMFGKVDPDIVAALDVLFILHADHEQNCSTSTVRLAGSSKANPYATISAGINALWGPLHGGANQAVIDMLQQIHNGGGDYREFLEKAKDKNDPFRLMGFGHRVYKNFDPRAKIIKQSCDTVLKKLGVQDPLLDIAKGLEEEALKDPYFVDRKLYPNVDFYSGIIYKALNIPTDMFTVMFALGRLPGWISQWREMLDSPAMKIGRPRQIYTGPRERKWIDVKNRK
ncbi:MAG: citrate synthase [Oligoflexales bacterium]